MSARLLRFGSSFTVAWVARAWTALALLGAVAPQTAPGQTITSFTASPPAISPGGSSTLSWTSTKATSATLTVGLSTKAVPVNGSQVVTLTATATATLTVLGAFGGTDTATVKVIVVPSPTIDSFTAGATQISQGGSTTLSWATTGATTASIDGGIGTVAVDGSVSVSPASTTKYTLTAGNSLGVSVSATVSVTVVPLPTISLFYAAPASVAAGGSSTLQWVVTGAAAVSIDKGIGTVASSGARSVSPAATTTYTLTAANSLGGTRQAQTTVTVLAPPVITSFTASPTHVLPGQPSTLTWTSTTTPGPVVSATISSSSGGTPVPVSTTGSRSVTPVVTTTYTLTVTDAVGSASATVTVTVDPPPQISSFTATPASVKAGQSSTLSWSTTGGSVFIDNGVGQVGASGTAVVTPTSSTTYVLTLTGSGGTATAQATVAVEGAPVITSFSASPGHVYPGQDATLAWASTGGTSATISSSTGGTPATVAPSGSRTVTPVQTTTYTLTVTGPGGSATATTKVTVDTLPAIQSFTATPAVVSQGGSSTLAWSTTAAQGMLVSIDNGVGEVPPSGTFVVTPSSTTTYTLTLDAGGTVLTARATVTVGCAPPKPGLLSARTAAVRAGQNVLLSWTAPSDLDAGARTTLEWSRDRFVTVLGSRAPRGLSAVVPTETAGAASVLSFRLRIQQGCGATATSNAVDVNVEPAAASVVPTEAWPALAARQGDAPPSAVQTFKNVGGMTGRLRLSAGSPFFTVSPDVLDLAPGEKGSATITALASALETPGSQTGLLRATVETLDARRPEPLAASDTLSAPVVLTVAPAATAAARVKSPVATVVFRAAAGASPDPVVLPITVEGVSGTGPVQLRARVGPGGSWLVLGPELSQPVPASGRVDLTLSVDRSLRSPWDGGLPYRTLLSLSAFGTDAGTEGAVVEILDVEPPAVVPGAGRRSAPAAVRSHAAPLAEPPGGSSFVVPSIVRASVGPQTYLSDGWLRNLGPVPAETELFFTPDGANGLTDPSVLAAAVTVPAGSTYRLSDLVSNVFSLGGVSGQLEVRSGTPWALSVRTTAESILGGDSTTRFGSEIPAFAWGGGVGPLDPELVVPAVSDDATNRANLVLAETTGQPATVRVTVNRPDGSELGSLARAVPPYGKVQVNRVVQEVAPGATLTGGWAGVSVESGTGHVVAVATVIDNRSGSFSAVDGANVPLAAASSRPAPLAAPPPELLVPTAVKTVGLYDTRFSTAISLVNLVKAEAPLDLTFRYVDMDDGNATKTVARPVVLGSRAALDEPDVIGGLFGLTARSYGSIATTGQVQQLVGKAFVRAQVDPDDPEKGMKTAQVNAVSTGQADTIQLAEGEHRFAGAEKSILRRTNLVLVESSGQPVRVAVRLYTPAGERLGERTYDLGPREYRQITDVFGGAGLDLGDGPFQDVEVTAEVVDGDGTVVALASVNDNVSRNPMIFVLKEPGPPTGVGVSR